MCIITQASNKHLDTITMLLSQAPPKKLPNLFTFLSLSLSTHVIDDEMERAAA
ncbi:unnamed protein product, partial [Prunus brigantina]